MKSGIRSLEFLQDSAVNVSYFVVIIHILVNGRILRMFHAVIARAEDYLIFCECYFL